MGRTKYLPEERRTVMSAFIKAAADIINREGIEGLSIRKVAADSGYSSATLYLYFEDLSELVSLASVTYLTDYITELEPAALEDKDARTRYLRTWELFCKHAFAQASVFSQLFFQNGEDNHVGNIVKEYYSIFPRELDNIDGTMLSMLTRGNLHERNLAVLEPLAKELKMDEATTNMVNDLTVAYFRDHLLRAAEKPVGSVEVEKLTESFMAGATFLLDR